MDSPIPMNTPIRSLGLQTGVDHAKRRQ